MHIWPAQSDRICFSATSQQNDWCKPEVFGLDNIFRSTPPLA